MWEGLEGQPVGEAIVITRENQRRTRAWGWRRKLGKEA